MIESLRPYAQMKATAAEWLPNVPSHWQVRRIKTLLREVDARSTTGEEDLLSLRMAAGLVDHREAGGRPIPPDALIGFKKIQPEQIVMNRMRAASGLFGIARKQGIVSPDYAVFEQREDANLDYLLKLFKMPAMAAVFRAESKGLGTGESGFLRLYTDRFGPIPIPHPPVDEQRLINRFLDWHGAMTARLIRAKKRLIGLLNEQKQTIIHRAVTRGLNSSAKLKPSGVDLLGDVPEGWEVKPLKWWADINALSLGKNTDPEYELDYLDISAVGTGFLTAEPERMRFAASPARARRVVAQNDTLVSTVRTYLKAIYFVADHSPNLIASTGFAVLTPHRDIDARFFAYSLQSPSFIDQVVWNSDGVAYPAINETRLGTLKVALPSAREEQSAIIQHLERETVSVDRGIETLKRELAAIQEFRTRLIADVVTGQLDVRAVAATLPDLTGEMVADELPNDTDPDETADDAEDEEAAAA